MHFALTKPFPSSSPSRTRAEAASTAPGDADALWKADFSSDGEAASDAVPATATATATATAPSPPAPAPGPAQETDHLLDLFGLDIPCATPASAPAVPADSTAEVCAFNPNAPVQRLTDCEAAQAVAEAQAEVAVEAQAEVKETASPAEVAREDAKLCGADYAAVAAHGEGQPAPDEAMSKEVPSEGQPVSRDLPDADSHTESPQWLAGRGCSWAGLGGAGRGQGAGGEGPGGQLGGGGRAERAGGVGGGRLSVEPGLPLRVVGEQTGGQRKSRTADRDMGGACVEHARCQSSCFVVSSSERMRDLACPTGVLRTSAVKNPSTSCLGRWNDIERGWDSWCSLHL